MSVLALRSLRSDACDHRLQTFRIVRDSRDLAQHLQHRRITERSGARRKARRLDIQLSENRKAVKPLAHRREDVHTLTLSPTSDIHRGPSPTRKQPVDRSFPKPPGEEPTPANAPT